MNELDELNNLLAESRENIVELLRLADQYKDRIEDISDQISELEMETESGRIPSSLSSRIEMDVREEAPHILKRNAIIAIEITDEFNTPDFIADITTAIFEPETFITSIDTYGHLSISIDLEATAGTIEDYARGILSARSYFPMTLDAKKASLIWSLIYRAGREGATIYTTYGKGGPREHTADRTAYFVRYYERTMSLRQSTMSGGLAPWWNIVDKGTSLEMSSNRGGTAYPKFAGRNFVETSEQQIRNYAEDVSTNTIGEYFDTLTNRVIEYKRLIEQYQEAIDIIASIDLSRPEIAKRFILEQVRKYNSSDKIERIDQNTLDEIANEIAAGTIDTLRRRLGAGAPRVRLISLLREYRALVNRILGK